MKSILKSMIIMNVSNFWAMLLLELVISDYLSVLSFFRICLRAN